MKEINTNASCSTTQTSDDFIIQGSSQINGAELFINILQNEITLSKIALEEVKINQLQDDFDSLNWQHETIIKMQGMDDNEHIENSSFPIEVEITFPQDDDAKNDYETDLITTLALKSSNQPWIINLNTQQYDRFIKKEDNNFLIDTNFLVTQGNERFADVKLLDNFSKSFNNIEITSDKNVTEINTIEIMNCNYAISGQIIQECNSYECSISNTVATSKYDSFSESVRKQVVDAIEVRGINTNDTIEISLHPEELGHIKIKCELQDKIKVNFEVEKITTLALLQQSATEIKDVIVKNFNSNLSTDLNFSMHSNGENTHYSDNKATNTTRSSFSLNEEKSPLQQETVMYFSNNGRISFVV